MNILCIICSEFLTNDDEMAVTLCGHCFHRKCIMEWIKNSQTCPNCRKSTSNTSIIKVFFENDQSRMNDLHNELLRNNEDMTKQLEEVKQKATKKETELVELTGKFREINDKVKNLERNKQLDDMALAGLRIIKEESSKEILKLNAQVNTLKLDLLAEKQLRRIHQTTLHKLDPKNENYDPKSVTIDDGENSEQPSNFSITPFWQLNAEAKKKDAEVKKDHSYIVPSKIQKACDFKFTKNHPRTNVRQKRSSNREENASVQLASTFPEITATSPTTANNNDNNTNKFTFRFGNSSGLSSLFRFGSTSNEPSTSHQNEPQSSSDFRTYRNACVDTPRPSER